MSSIVVISSEEKGEYFLSKDHCQNHGMGADYVAVTHYLPSNVVPRMGLEDGIIKNIEDLILVFYSDKQKIENPNKKFKL